MTVRPSGDQTGSQSEYPVGSCRRTPPRRMKKPLSYIFTIQTTPLRRAVGLKGHGLDRRRVTARPSSSTRCSATGIRLYDAPGGGIARLARVGSEPTPTASVRYRRINERNPEDGPPASPILLRPQ